MEKPSSIDELQFAYKATFSIFDGAFQDFYSIEIQPPTKVLAVLMRARYVRPLVVDPNVQNVLMKRDREHSSIMQGGSICEPIVG